MRVVPACLRGDDPEALALRPSHVLRAIVAISLWRAPCNVSLASGHLQGCLTIDRLPGGVKYLGQVILRIASSPPFRSRHDLFGGCTDEPTCVEMKYAFHYARNNMPRTSLTAQTRIAAVPAGARLGERLRQLRVAAGLTQSDLAGERFSK